MRDKSAAFTLPCIPSDSPQAPQPEDISLPLFPHQLRSLYLMKIMEDRSQLENIIPGKDYKTKGGIIADEVGMGKTALVIGLILSNKRQGSEVKDEGSLGGTLVITPDHLCHQWQKEVRKFSKLRCMILNNVNQVATKEGQALLYQHDVIVASMDIISRLNFGAAKEGGPWIWRRVVFDECHEAIKFGTGFDSFTSLQAHSRNVWLVTGTPFPHGDESMYAMHRLLGIKFKLVVSNNIFQRKNVPLAADHPFECLKNRVYLRNTRASTRVALGGSPTKNVVEERRNTPALTSSTTDTTTITSSTTTSSTTTTTTTTTSTTATTTTTTTTAAPAEQIQRISNPASNFDEIIIRLDLSSVERGFYDSQLRRGEYANPFSNNLIGLRMLCCHPAVEQAFSSSASSSQLAGLQNLEQLRKRFLVVKEDLAEKMKEKVEKTQLAVRAAYNALVLVDDMRSSHPEGGCEADGVMWWRLMKEVNGTHVVNLVNQAGKARSLMAEMSPEDRTRFLDTTIEWIQSAKGRLSEHQAEQKNLERDLHYFQSLVTEIQEEPKKECMLCTEEVTLVSITPCGHFACTACLSKWVGLQHSCPVCRKVLSEGELTKVDTTKLAPLEQIHSTDPMVDRFGTKPAALIRFIQSTLAHDHAAKFIVFSQWHSALALLSQSLQAASISNCIYLAVDKETNPQDGLARFTDGPCRVLMLSLESQAAGLNLQCANHVILMEPPGSNPNDALSIETQAVGRALRIGQTRRLTVTRLLLRNTIEEKLYELTQATRIRTGPAATSSLLSALNLTSTCNQSANVSHSLSSLNNNDINSSSNSSSNGSSNSSSNSSIHADNMLTNGGKRTRRPSTRLLDSAPVSTPRSKRSRQAESPTTTTATPPTEPSTPLSQGRGSANPQCSHFCTLCLHNVPINSRKRRVGCSCCMSLQSTPSSSSSSSASSSVAQSPLPSSTLPSAPSSPSPSPSELSSELEPPKAKRGRKPRAETEMASITQKEEPVYSLRTKSTTKSMSASLSNIARILPPGSRCPICGRECATVHNLRVHYEAKHADVQLGQASKRPSAVNSRSSCNVPNLSSATSSTLAASTSTMTASNSTTDTNNNANATTTSNIPLAANATSFSSSSSSCLPSSVPPSSSSQPSNFEPSLSTCSTSTISASAHAHTAVSRASDDVLAPSTSILLPTSSSSSTSITSLPPLSSIPTCETKMSTSSFETPFLAVNDESKDRSDLRDSEVRSLKRAGSALLVTDSDSDSAAPSPIKKPATGSSTSGSAGSTSTSGGMTDVPWITDKMHCPICEKDLTGLSNVQVNKHIDSCCQR